MTLLLSHFQENAAAAYYHSRGRCSEGTCAVNSHRTAWRAPDRPPEMDWSERTAAQPLSDRTCSAGQGVLRIAVTVVVLIVFSMLHLELSHGVWRPGQATPNQIS
eukprot:TRINITY_DN1329_c0_g1_i1.p1 TRINITY_DN1329_c0_g1~~TRINITY_DN1329_c0_g1_i1.p1  ORF type:complete len:105 (+),score=14.18 TRINITY_DN1329_c0_g1_i1:195-509(+)